MRSVFLFIAAAATAFACQGRHIDYSVGVGPQGGPGYKTQPGNDGPSTIETVDVVIRPDNIRQPRAEFPFSIDVSCGSATNAWQFFTSTANQVVYQTNPLAQARATSRCLTESCSSVEVALAPMTFAFGSSYGNCQAELGTLRLESQLTQDCELKGKFDGEAQRTWATGSMTEMKLTEIPQQPNVYIYAYPGSAHLETADDLAPTDTPEKTFQIIKGEHKEITLTLRVPTHSGDGKVITLLENPFYVPLEKDARGHYVATWRFSKFGSQKLLNAHVDFSCR